MTVIPALDAVENKFFCRQGKGIWCKIFYNIMDGEEADLE